MTTITVPRALAEAEDLKQRNIIGIYPLSVVALADEVQRLRAALAQQAEPSGWRPISTAPKDGTDILIHYVTEHGNHVRCIAHWTAAKTVESTYNDDDDVGEYDDETDAWYVPEGWYENLYNWDEYRGVFIHEGKPDSWQPLPAAPKESSNG